jgi:hypothetical protein
VKQWDALTVTIITPVVPGSKTGAQLCQRLGWLIIILKSQNHAGRNTEHDYLERYQYEEKGLNEEPDGRPNCIDTDWVRYHENNRWYEYEA